jgi:ubiquinone/menaquinone biosynthesis C-methylase UbiE
LSSCRLGFGTGIAFTISRRNEVRSMDDRSDPKASSPLQQQTASALAEFDRWSDRYDDSFLQRIMFRPSHTMMFQHLTSSDRTLLDIGCGTGAFAARLLQHLPDMEIWGYDLSPKMLDVSATRFQQSPARFHPVRGDSERLPFPEDTFDAITCSHSFHHYPRQAEVVAEMYRVLKPGGRLMIIDGYRDLVLGRIIFDWYVPLTEGKVHHCSAQRFRELFDLAGFTQVAQQIRYVPPPVILTIGQAAKATRADRLRLSQVA